MIYVALGTSSLRLEACGICFALLACSGDPESSRGGGALGNGGSSGFSGTGGFSASGGSGATAAVGGTGAGGGSGGSGAVAGGTGGWGGSSGGAGGSTGGAGGIGGINGTGGAGGVVDDRPPCMTDPQQVISMGDSYMNWTTHTFPSDLNAAAGVTFRPTYAIGGLSMGSGGIGLIPTLWDTAIAQNPNIIAVVLDGGGNDVLLPALGSPDCKNMANAASNPGCQAIVTTALTAAGQLMQRMVAGHVHDVIYFFYPHVPAPTALGGSYPNVMLDYALPLVRKFCEDAVVTTNGALHCWFVDTVPIFEGHSTWFAAGDIHENSMGSQAIAKAVVDTMKQHCIAQPVSSGCCRP